MCGIVGILHKQAEDFIEPMSKAIAHRGPDGNGLYIGKHIALAHQRLAIQDLSERGAQPMYSTNGQYLIVYNGEIYNHWDLRNEFLAGVDFCSTSDTETILYGYIKYGKDFIHKLNGIFAFAIYNIETGHLFLARDHFGVKPLYYYVDDNGLLFSSEIKAFLGYPGLNEQVDLESLKHYVSYLYSPGSGTPFQYVKKLQPGHFISVYVDQPNSLEIEKYYEIPFGGTYSTATEKQLIDELDGRLRLAVKRQLLSDVPVGFFLSGGLDSSLIVAMAKLELQGKPVKCYTIETDSQQGREGFTDDLPYARKVAEFLDVDLEVIQAKVDIIQDFDKMIWHLDEPQADAAPLNVWNICKKARSQGYTVLLGGTGGDDLFSGYRRHQLIYYYRFLSLIPNILLNGFNICLSFASIRNATVRRMRKIVDGLVMFKGDQRLAALFLWLTSPVVSGLFKPRASSSQELYSPETILINSLKNIPLEKSLLNKMLFWEQKYFLPDHNLNYTDKMGMAHGVEIRVPFLDKELVEFSTMIPPALKMKGSTTKYILKKVAERYLPYDVIYRPKTGFGAPIREWITQDLHQDIQHSFHVSSVAQDDIFQNEAVLKLVDDNQQGKVDAAYPILALLSIKSWCKQFVSAKKNPEYTVYSE